MDCVKDLEEGLERGESFAADVALSCWNLHYDAVMSLSMVWSTEALRIR